MKDRIHWTGPSVRANDIEGLLNSDEYKADVAAASKLVHGEPNMTHIPDPEFVEYLKNEVKNEFLPASTVRMMEKAFIDSRERRQVKGVDVDRIPDFYVISYGHDKFHTRHELHEDVETAAIRANILQHKGFSIVKRRSLIDVNDPVDVTATFECKENGITGSTSATVKRVDYHDDGGLEVVLDHWPQPKSDLILERANALKAIKDEPECPDSMPDDMWAVFKNAVLCDDKAYIEEIFRFTVRETKNGILERYRDTMEK